jgi:hypothetical protein
MPEIPYLELSISDDPEADSTLSLDETQAAENQRARVYQNRKLHCPQDSFEQPSDIVDYRNAVGAIGWRGERRVQHGTLGVRRVPKRLTV